MFPRRRKLFPTAAVTIGVILLASSISCGGEDATHQGRSTSPLPGHGTGETQGPEGRDGSPASDSPGDTKVTPTVSVDPPAPAGPVASPDAGFETVLPIGDLAPGSSHEMPTLQPVLSAEQSTFDGDVLSPTTR